MEDIKILEEIIESYKECFVENYEMCVDVGMRLRDLQAIENLIARNKELETLLQGNLYQKFLYYKELAGRYQANSISKDKVKEKIEELQNETCKIISRTCIPSISSKIFNDNREKYEPMLEARNILINALKELLES